MMKNNENTNTRKKLQDYSYCLSHNIGKGYSSSVYKGRNDLTDETVAIKVIDMRMLKGEVHKSLLASQIEVLKCFKNTRNIIQVYDIYTTKNNTYIITELCDGGDLSKFISSKKGMIQRDALQYLRQIVDGYSEISSNRIIHRDLKPANILLKNNKIKIADFGFAMKSSDSKKYSSYNVGSPIYMPPQALNDNKYSYKSDVWAIGVIYYELLTGRTPWKAKTQKQLGKQLLSVPISKVMPNNISQISKQLLQRTLCINYDRRMSPQQLDNYMNKFDSILGIGTSSHQSSSYNNNHIKTTHSFLTNSTGLTAGTQCSIRGIHDDEQLPKRHQTSLNKNTINTPKNMRRFTFLKGTNNNINTNTNTHTNININSTNSNFHTHTNTHTNINHNGGALEQIKNSSLPKTASTINQNRTQSNLGQTQTQTQGQGQSASLSLGQCESNKKRISKQLLSQVHFCRFVYKLIQRIQNKINGQINISLKQYMYGIIFNKLNDIIQLNNLINCGAQQYRKSNDYKKICQIVNQYIQKYQKQLNKYNSRWEGFDVFQNQLTIQIKQIYQDIHNSNNNSRRQINLEQQQIQQKIIILDYLITLRQLSNLLAKNDIQLFHSKSKIQAIVQGAPAKIITDDHVKAITNKLKAIKLI